MIINFLIIIQVNNINRYMQKINLSKPIEWGNWTYKVGDKVLFNESRRFGNVLYNNLKGSILSIDKKRMKSYFKYWLIRLFLKEMFFFRISNSLIAIVKEVYC